MVIYMCVLSNYPLKNLKISRIVFVKLEKMAELKHDKENYS